MTLFGIGVEAPEGAVHGSAIFSDDLTYRYSLARWWDNSLPRDLWVMCNPSTADGAVNDATIRRCIGFSKRFGSGGLVVVNAYAYRATKPADMWAARAEGTDIVGPENDGWIRAHCMNEHGRVILAWGAHPKPERIWHVQSLIRAENRTPMCLGTTKNGQPRHPLMLANETQLERWEAAA